MWNVVTDYNGWIAIEDEEGIQILRFDEKQQSGDVKISEENANLVVKAVNLYKKLQNDETVLLSKEEKMQLEQEAIKFTRSIIESNEAWLRESLASKIRL